MQLDDWLTARLLNNRQFAALVGATRSAVGRWRRGVRNPSAPYMRKIVEATRGQVTPSDFFLDAAGAPEPTAPAPEPEEEGPQ